jgi:hypothetical protein
MTDREAAMLGTNSCPFARLCERDLAGPELSPEEQLELEAHLTQGCPACEERIERQLDGLLPPDDPGAAERAELDRALARSLKDASARMAAGQANVLERIKLRVREEERSRGRLLRRRHLRALFYVTTVAGTLMLFVAYAGTVMAARVQRRAALRTETATEVVAMAHALERWAREHGGELPADLPAALAALSSSRGERAYYPLQAGRLGPEGYRDPFGGLYRYRREPGRGWLWSSGPDGRDDRGEPDDLVATIVVSE